MPGQHEREGRWWWEDAKAKECGLHNVSLLVTKALEWICSLLFLLSRRIDQFLMKLPGSTKRPCKIFYLQIGFFWYVWDMSQGNVNGAASNAISEQMVEVADLFMSRSVSHLSRGEMETLVGKKKRSKSSLVVLYAPWCQFSQVSFS
jgi:hypothetical protein